VGVRRGAELVEGVQPHPEGLHGPHLEPGAYTRPHFRLTLTTYWGIRCVVSGFQ